MPRHMRLLIRMSLGEAEVVVADAGGAAPGVHVNGIAVLDDGGSCWAICWASASEATLNTKMPLRPANAGNFELLELNRRCFRPLPRPVIHFTRRVITQHDGDEKNQ